jgi:hypothetical protein
MKISFSEIKATIDFREDDSLLIKEIIEELLNEFSDYKFCTVCEQYVHEDNYAEDYCSDCSIDAGGAGDEDNDSEN